MSTDGTAGAGGDEVDAAPAAAAADQASGSWQAQRREAAEIHAEALERRERAESAQARVLIEQFLRDADAAGVEPVPLAARSYDGRARYRTPLRGWYLRRNETVAIGTDGQFYVLTVPGSLRARLTGVEPVPSEPPIILGKGGRDGESIDLADALARIVRREV